MHRSLTTAALAAALWLGLTNQPAAHAAPPAVDKARSLLAQGDAQGAIAVLEASLPSTKGADRAPLLDALRDAYPAAIRQADSQGKTGEADSYRDNLEILTRKSRTPAPASAPAPTAEEAKADLIPLPIPKDEVPKTDPAVERAVLEPSAGSPSESLPPLPALTPADTPPPALSAPDAPPAQILDDKPAAAALIPLPHSGSAATTEPPPPIQMASIPTPTPTPAPPPSPAPVLGRLKAAVEAFKAEHYEEAGRLFSELERQGKLPAELKRHWAYCRAVDVVRRINARPDSPQDWASIDSEIQSIKAIAPSDWYTEYLRNLASERNRDPQSPAARSNQVVVRGSSPEEPPLPKAAGGMVAAQPTPTPGPGPAPAPAQGQPIRWSRQPIESANFVVIHVDKDRALAEQAAQAAEAAREAQVKRWGAASEAWAPRCEIVLFPNARDFARETLQPADSPGFSTMGMNGGRIVLRRVHLRTDHPSMVKAILPHEITHVVLADLFPTQQIPRWADEGMAVLAEPHSEQATRAADLNDPLRSGRVFRVGDLMAMDYPKPEHWGLYYAQSVSLTRFLVETGSPGQFVRFVQQSQQSGIEPALKQVYAIASFADLQNRWLAYAREKTSTTALTASSDPEKRPTTPR